jgi:hypothetical protein
MQSAMGKLFCRVLQDKYLTENYETSMCDEQGGFRRDRRCAQQHFILVDTIHRSIAEGRGLFVVFVIIQKAYPSAWQDGLFYKLRRAEPHVNGHVIELLKNCITDGETRVFLQGLQATPYTSCMGVREGAVWSPQACSTTSSITLWLTSRQQDVKALRSLRGGWLPSSQMTLSWCQTARQTGLDVLYTFCCKWRLSMSMSKTKLMRIGNTADYDESSPLHVGVDDILLTDTNTLAFGSLRMVSGMMSSESKCKR